MGTAMGALIDASEADAAARARRDAADGGGVGNLQLPSAPSSPSGGDGAAERPPSMKVSFAPLDADDAVSSLQRASRRDARDAEKRAAAAARGLHDPGDRKSRAVRRTNAEQWELAIDEEKAQLGRALAESVLGPAMSNVDAKASAAAYKVSE